MYAADTICLFLKLSGIFIMKKWPPHHHLRALTLTAPTAPMDQRGAGRRTRTWGSSFPGNKLEASGYTSI